MVFILLVPEAQIFSCKTVFADAISSKGWQNTRKTEIGQCPVKVTSVEFPSCFLNIGFHICCRHKNLFKLASQFLKV